MLTRTSLIMASLVMSLAACGGGHKALRVDDARLVRLPSEARQSILDEERPVRVAEINLDGANVALRDAKDFQGIVEHERSAAKQQLEAAQKSQKLAQGASDAALAESARADEAAAKARLEAADAKLEYAKQLVSFRGDIVAQRQAELDAARAELEVRKAQALVSAGQGEGIDQRAFDRAAVDARKRAGEARGRVEGRRDKLEARRSKWQALRGGAVGLNDVPPPPSALQDVQ